MEYFKNGSLNDLEELQRISQSAYVEALLDLLNKDDVNKYIMSKYSLDNLKQELEDMSNHFLFFIVGDKAVGYIKYILKPNSLEIDRLYMLKSYKGMGVGSKFMNKVEDVAKLNEKKVLTLGVLEINKPAISFYEKRGFIQYSREAVSIGNTKYPLLLLKKELA